MSARLRERRCPVLYLRLDDVDGNVVNLGHQVLTHFFGGPVGQVGALPFMRWIVWRLTGGWVACAHALIVLDG